MIAGDCGDRCFISCDRQWLWRRSPKSLTTRGSVSYFLHVFPSPLPHACLFLLSHIFVNGFNQKVRMKSFKVFKTVLCQTSRDQPLWLGGEGCLIPSPCRTHESQIQNLVPLWFIGFLKSSGDSKHLYHLMCGDASSHESVHSNAYQTRIT